MVRRALLDHGDELTTDDEALSDSWPPAARPGRLAQPWRGAGGRWLVWVARVVVWAVIVLIGYRGVLAIVEGHGAGNGTAGPSRPASAAKFPVTAAEAYALEFGNVYLNFSPATASARSQALVAFLPAGADPQLGWNGEGTQQLLDEQVAGISVTGDQTAVVTLLARLSTGSLIELGVPVYASGGGMSVSGDPALLPGPALVAAPPTSHAGDQAAEAALQTQLAAFFPAYASGDQATLARFLVPGARIVGLGGQVSFGAITSVSAPPGGATRKISVTVTWVLPSPPVTRAGKVIASAPASLQMTYAMTVVERAGSWDVQSIGASTEALPQGPP
jgi:Conjugative transposon protein TcpC